jgi:hypothetical protein
MRSHNVSELLAYVKSNSGISSFIYCLLFYFYTIFLFITAKRKMTKHRRKVRCVACFIESKLDLKSQSNFRGKYQKFS